MKPFEQLYRVIKPAEPIEEIPAWQKREAVRVNKKPESSVNDIIHAMGYVPQDWTDDEKKAIAEKLGKKNQ
jgi:uncharacterized protein YbgA (DUF1722 family)